jgi:hypothetical protein
MKTIENNEFNNEVTFDQLFDLNLKRILPTIMNCR